MSTRIDCPCCGESLMLRTGRDMALEALKIERLEERVEQLRKGKEPEWWLLDSGDRLSSKKWPNTVKYLYQPFIK